MIGLVISLPNKRKRKYKKWVRDIFKRRNGGGSFNLVRETVLADKEMFFRYMRMTPLSFEHFLSLVAAKIAKQTTNYREPIPPQQRLSVTFCHLATGESHISLSLQYRIGHQTVSKIIPETCKAIYEAVAPIYMKMPTSPEEWLKISEEFQVKWNLPHGVGALDGKHIHIRCASKTGSLYHNYKGFFSMVLLAVCNANYRFITLDFCQYGNNNDSGVLFKSSMGKKLELNDINLPSAISLDRCNFDPLPYFLEGDEIFSLKTYLMRPYPGSSLTEEEAVYNYRHSRARRVTENTFGILCSRWRIFFTSIHAKVENVENIVMAFIALHNYLKETDNAMYCPTGFIDHETATGEVIPGRWR